MSTGQFPQRRETEAQAKRRDEKIRQRAEDSGNPDYREKYWREEKKVKDALVRSQEQELSE